MRPDDPTSLHPGPHAAIAVQAIPTEPAYVTIGVAALTSRAPDPALRPVLRCGHVPERRPAFRFPPVDTADPGDGRQEGLVAAKPGNDQSVRRGCGVRRFLNRESFGQSPHPSPGFALNLCIAAPLSCALTSARGRVRKRDQHNKRNFLDFFPIDAQVA